MSRTHRGQSAHGHQVLSDAEASLQEEVPGESWKWGGIVEAYEMILLFISTARHAFTPELLCSGLHCIKGAEERSRVLDSR